MLLTYSIYFLLLFLFIYKSKFAGFGKIFNDDFLDLDATKALGGLTAILIILHHISQEVAFQDVTKELFFFNDIGFLLTAIFLFNSGYGLSVSSKKDPNYINSFFKKRVPKLLIPFFISNIVFSIVALINGEPILKVVLGIFGFIAINHNGWFPVTLLVLYLTFYFNQKHIKNDYLQIAVYLIVICLMTSIFCINGHYAWWAGNNGRWLTPTSLDKLEWWKQMQQFLFSGEWWVNSSSAFVLGIIFGKWNDNIVSFFKKGYFYKLIISILLFAFSYLFFIKIRAKYGYWTEYSMISPGIKDKFITSVSQFLVPSLFVLSLEIFSMKIRCNNSACKFLGKISYETYLYGYLSILIFRFIISKEKYGYLEPIVKQPYNWNLFFYVLTVIGFSVIIGYIFNKIDNLIIKKICK